MKQDGQKIETKRIIKSKMKNDPRKKNALLNLNFNDFRSLENDISDHLNVNLNFDTIGAIINSFEIKKSVCF